MGRLDFSKSYPVYSREQLTSLSPMRAQTRWVQPSIQVYGDVGRTAVSATREYHKRTVSSFSLSQSQACLCVNYKSVAILFSRQVEESCNHNFLYVAVVCRLQRKKNNISTLPIKSMLTTNKYL